MLNCQHKWTILADFRSENAHTAGEVSNLAYYQTHVSINISFFIEFI